MSYPAKSRYLPGRWLSLFPVLIGLILLTGQAVASPIVTMESLCAALPADGDLPEGIVWMTEGAFCPSGEGSGSSSIYYNGYDSLEKKNTVGTVQVSITWYPEDISATQEFMSDPEAYRESQREFWEEYGSLEDIGDLPGGLLLTSDENTRWWSTCQAFFWRAPGLYGDVKVQGNGNLEKLGIDRNSFARSEALRIAELIHDRLPGDNPKPAISFTCPVGGDAPLAIDPGIPGKGLCRGACGYDCPGTCAKLPDLTLYVPSGDNEYYSCNYQNVTSCGSHPGCREHDACYDKCVAEKGETSLFGSCHKDCDQGCTDLYGYMNCTGWLAGWPPFDMNLTFSDPPVASGPFTGQVPE